jgi:hypothetical protein
MSLSLAIALNVIADVGLLGGLAFVMSRPALLRPHAERLAPVVELQLLRARHEQAERAA